MGAKKREALEQFNRDNILTAAAELFSTKGVDKTTMDDIASFADYSKSTIYVYFRSKEDIYNSVLARRYTDLMLEVSRLELGRGDIEDGYYKLCSCLVEFERLYPSYFASLMGEDRSTNSRKSAEAAPSADQEIENVFRDFLKNGIEKKVLKAELDIDKTAMYMLTTIGGAIRYASKRAMAIEQRLHITKDEYLRFCFESLYASIRK